MSALARMIACTSLALALPAMADHHDTLESVIKGQQRTEANRARDAWRHPAETLEFFGFEPDMTVVEVYPGGGWYTEILAPALRDKGKLIAAHYGEDTGSEYRTRSHREFVAKLAAEPTVYDRVEVTSYAPGKDALGERGSADLVLTFRNIHGLVQSDQLGAFLADAHAVLNDGGVLGIVQHRAPAGADPATSAKKGYVPQDWLVEQARAAGFELDAESEVNANPKDTTDHPEGVWTLPPTLRMGEKDRAKYEALGESDRMTLKFLKR